MQWPLSVFVCAVGIWDLINFGALMCGSCKRGGEFASAFGALENVEGGEVGVSDGVQG